MAIELGLQLQVVLLAIYFELKLNNKLMFETHANIESEQRLRKTLLKSRHSIYSTYQGHSSSS
jgi:hypothetical protein